jgi:SAM-dependent methyltransferase
MISVGRSRVAGLANKPRFRVQGFQELADENRFDAIICSYDSINYLLFLPQVEDFLRRVNTALRPGGLFVFDICTEQNSKRHFSSKYFLQETDEFRLRREAYYDQAMKIQENRFWIAFPDEPDIVYREVHKQKIYSVKEIKKAVAQSGLALLHEYADFTRKSPGRRTMRVHFICKRR